MTMPRAPRFGEGQVYTTHGNDEPYYFSNALCKYTDPEVFFPDERKFKHHTENKQVKIAKKICGDCEHEIDCAAYAILRPYLEGIWGGTTTQDRKRIRKEYDITGISDSTYNNDDVNSN